MSSPYATYDTSELADYLKVSSRTVIRWRDERKGPAYCKAGHRVLYRQCDIDAWLEANKHVMVREAA